MTTKKKIEKETKPVFDVFAEFATDEKAEVEGRKMPLTAGAGLIVARANNDRYNARILELYEANREAIDDGGVASKALAELSGDAAEEAKAQALRDRIAKATAKDEEIGIQALAETVLVGVYGDLNFQGKPMVYSPAAAVVWLRVKDVRRRVIMFSQNIDNYRVLAEEADRGN